MHSINWDDLRYVLAVASAGSVSAAARELGVNHATVLRRVAAFEARFGAEVFDKGPRGYEIPPDRLRVIEAAREVAQAMQSVERLMHGAEAPMRGELRITSTDSLCQYLLPDVLTRIRKKADDLRIDLLSTNARVDLARLHADITVRPATSLPADLIGTAVAPMRFEVYGIDDTTEDWLGTSGALLNGPVGSWMQEAVDPASIVGSADSFVTLSHMARLGLGRCILPCFVGDSDPDLKRIAGAMPEMTTQIWVASHSDLAEVPRLRTMRAMLGDEIAAQTDRLMGLT